MTYGCSTCYLWIQGQGDCRKSNCRKELEVKMWISDYKSIKYFYSGFVVKYIFFKYIHNNEKVDSIMHIQVVYFLKEYKIHKIYPKDTWAAQSVKCLTSAQVTISQFVSSSPASASVLTAQSLEPTSSSGSPSLSASPCSCYLSFSFKNK